MMKMKSKTTLVVDTNNFIRLRLLKARFYCFLLKYTESIKIYIRENALPRRSKVTIWTLNPTVDLLF